MLKTLSITAVTTLWLFYFSVAPTPAQQPAVAAAVAPIFPRLAAAVNASGSVIVEVKIDRTGAVVSGNVIEGNPLFYEAAQEAAQLWRFVAAPAGDESRVVRLTFVFSIATEATEAELPPVFTPPYQVEVKFQVSPYIDVNERPELPVFKKTKKKGKATHIRKPERQINNKNQSGQPTADPQQISRNDAIAIANRDAAKNYNSLAPFNVVACERARLWVIIYDGGGSEYYIDKESGDILYVQKSPQVLNVNAVSSGAGSSNRIEKEAAVEIARKHFVDFLVSYGDDQEHVNKYDSVACELTNSWRIFFEYRAAPNQNPATLPNNNPPNYVIDKRTGKIIFTTHQAAL